MIVCFEEGRLEACVLALAGGRDESSRPTGTSQLSRRELDKAGDRNWAVPVRSKE